MTNNKNHNFKIASDDEITAPNYLAAVLPSVTVRIESYRFNGSYDGSKSLPEKLLAHMAKESEKESEKR